MRHSGEKEESNKAWLPLSKEGLSTRVRAGIVESTEGPNRTKSQRKDTIFFLSSGLRCTSSPALDLKLWVLKPSGSGSYASGPLVFRASWPQGPAEPAHPLPVREHDERPGRAGGGRGRQEGEPPGMEPNPNRARRGGGGAASLPALGPAIVRGVAA